MKVRWGAAAVLGLLTSRAPGGCPSGVSPDAWSVRATADFSSVVISNVSHKPDAAEVACRWTVLRDGEPAARGSFPLHVFRQGPVRPGQAVTNAVPPVVRELGSRGGEMALRVRLLAVSTENPHGTCLAEDQIDFPGSTYRSLPPCDRPPKLERAGAVWRLLTRGVTYVFDRRRATLAAVATGRWFETDWLARPVELAAPFDCRLVSATLSDPLVTNATVSFSAVTRWVPDGAAACALTAAANWTVRGDGWLFCRSEVRPDGRQGAPDRVGWRFALAPSMPLLQYYGRPEGAAFAARGVVADEAPGVFRATAVRALALDAGWDHLSFAAAGAPFDAELVRDPSAGCLVLKAPSGGETAQSASPLAFALCPGKRLSALPARTEALPATPSPAPVHVLYDSGARAGYPRVRVADLGRTVTANGVRLRPDGSGRVKAFAFEVSHDRVKWTRAAAGTLPDADAPQEFLFTAPAAFRYWRLAATGGYGNSNTAATAAIEVMTQ